MHFPYAFKEGEGDFPKPGPEEQHHELAMSDTDYLETWQGMEGCVDAGLVRDIGVCNFTVSQLKRLLENCRIKPSMVQVEIHPFLPNKKLVDFCQQNNIAVTAYSSLGNPSQAGDKFNLLEDERVKKIATKHNKTPGQILLRFQWIVASASSLRVSIQSA
jgi:diketogulonate reductase-like aldo/keto reductase